MLIVLQVDFLLAARRPAHTVYTMSFHRSAHHPQNAGPRVVVVADELCEQDQVKGALDGLAAETPIATIVDVTPAESISPAGLWAQENSCACNWHCGDISLFEYLAVLESEGYRCIVLSGVKSTRSVQAVAAGYAVCDISV